MIKPIIRPGEKGYRQCSVTIMDTTDPDIQFNDSGASNWVDLYNKIVANGWKPEGDPSAFSALMNRIKLDGQGKDYDCAIGLSGGVDSSYLAYLAKREGLRPLVIHTDVGWNSDIAVGNIEKIIKKCGFDLITLVVDWEEMADLQRAFLRSGVPNQDIPQDHAIFAGFYGAAVKHKIKWVLSGENLSCESILPSAWGYSARDLRHLMAIHRQFGTRPLRSFPKMGQIRYGLNYMLARGLTIAKPLNLVSFSRDEAIRKLETEFGWKYYGGKHYESRWTRFFQGWWLPKRFGYDKRLAHLSSMVLSGQITRQAALEEMQQTSYSETMMEEDLDLILKKLDLTKEDWRRVLNSPVKSHEEYPNSRAISRVLFACRNVLRKISLAN